MKIYTRTGDKGETSLLGGTRVSKSHDRINAYGTVDELNSWIGLMRDQEACQDLASELKTVQDRLFTLGSTLATDPGKTKVKRPDLETTDILVLEEAMDRMNENLPEMKNFVLPGGHQSVSFCHIARTVCRRAERLVIELSHAEHVDELVTQYLNRLSDYLFVLSRHVSAKVGAEETPWTPRY